MISYIDTLTISKKMSIPITTLKSHGWILRINPNNPIASHYAIEITAPDGINIIYLKYFYHRYFRSLTIQFNVRKLLTSSSNNSNPVSFSNKGDVYAILDAAIRPGTSSYLPNFSFANFTVKRMDIAHNHIISENASSEFFKMLKQITSPLFHKYQYSDHTGYFNSSPIRYGNSGIIFKYYNKTEEMLSKGFSSSDAYDKEIEHHHQILSEIVDDGYLIEKYTSKVKFVKVRFEVSLKSAKITRSLQKHQLANTLDNVLDESFQLQLLNEYVMILKLDAPFTTNSTTFKHIDRLYPNRLMNARMKKAVTLISNGNINTLKKQLKVKDPDAWIRKHSNILYDNSFGCHIFYTRTIDFLPVIIPVVSSPLSSPNINTP